MACLLNKMLPPSSVKYREVRMCSDQNVDFVTESFCYCFCSTRNSYLKHIWNYIFFEKRGNIFDMTCILFVWCICLEAVCSHLPWPKTLWCCRGERRQANSIWSFLNRTKKATDRGVWWSPLILGSPLALSEALSFLKYFNSFPSVPSSSPSDPFSSCF